MSLPTEIISFDCLMIEFLTSPNPALRFNYIRLYTFYSLTLLIILIAYLSWRGEAWTSELTVQQRVDKTVSPIAIIWFLFYPTIVSYLASSISCTSIEGTSRLYIDFEKICYQDRPLNVLYAV